jgi:hypothetical protein
VQNQTFDSTAIWAAATFATAALPDARLNKRLVFTASVMAARPWDSIPQAFEGWGDAKAAYRLIENNRVTIESIRDPVAAKAARDCGGKRLVYAIQDTTTLAFANSATMEGLGPIDKEDSEARGMFLHSTLAVDEDGLAIGVLDQQYWCRNPEEKGKKYLRTQLPLKDKESVKWLWGIEAARRVIDGNVEPDARPRLIHVFDREGDIHEILEIIVNSPDGTVIRSAQNRKTTEEGELAHAHAAVRKTPVLATLSVNVKPKKDQKERVAQVELRAREVVLNPTPSTIRPKSPISLFLVEVWEPAPPEGAERLHWLLWTTEKADDPDGACWALDVYRKRPQIEEMHLILKSGCRIEELQFETAERTAKVVALYVSIAVRLLQLRTRARVEPDAPCTVILTEAEWHTLYVAIHRKPLPKRIRPPTLRQAVLWIGRLGGHLNRKRDGMPGVRTLWRGWRDLNLMLPIYQAGKSSR